MSDRIPMTRVGYDKIKAELDYLHTVELPKILEGLATARAEGDLSENAEYHGRQESRGMMEARINVLRDKLARAEGDLTENAEYTGAQESRGMMEARINVLRDKLSRAVLIDPSQFPKDEVAFGATVRVKDLAFGDEEEFTLVGAGEEDYDVGKILFTSPLAQGLAGKKVGDRVEIEVPAGVQKFEILAIRFDQ